MRELPILFSTPMVQAILGSRKTMTRRTAGLDHINIIPENWICLGYNEHNIMKFFNEKANLKTSAFSRYNVGDHIWVKETFAFAPLDELTKPYYPKLSDYIYKASSNLLHIKWKPSLFMPKAAARLWLEVTSVRCERLQEISEADAIAEGIEKIQVNTPFEGYKEYFIPGTTIGIKPVDSFYSLWMSINGIESLQSNPWVFVYEFKRIDHA